MEDDMQFYLGQIFENYPPIEAVTWSIENQYEIVEVDENKFQIKEPYFKSAEAIAERTAQLSLTAADVERALYKAFGKDFDDIISMVQELQPEGLDIKALKIELKANIFIVVIHTLMPSVTCWV